MKVFDLGADGGKVLLVKQNGKFNAVGTKCSHYGAPLVTGALGKGNLRCPWHGACFNLGTGIYNFTPLYLLYVSQKVKNVLYFKMIYGFACVVLCSPDKWTDFD